MSSPAPLSPHSPRLLVNALALHDVSDAARAFLENLIEQLPAAWPEARIMVLARKGAAVPTVDGRVVVIRVRSAGSGMLRVLEDFVRLPGVVRRVRPNVVINPNESVSRHVGAPVVVVVQNLLFHCHGVEPITTGPLPARLRSQLQFRFYRWQYPRAYAHADALVVVSAHAARELSRAAGLDPARARIVHCGADRLPTRSRRETTGPMRLLAIGAVAQYKRLDTAVRALGVLRRDGGDYELVMAGGSWPGYGDVIDRLAREEDVAGHVKRLGSVTAEPLADLLAGAHATVTLSSCESFGIPVVEGMRAGVPAVVADEPWSAETVGDAAVRVDGSNPESVARGIRTLADPSEWQRRAEAGRRVSAAYTWRRNAAGIVAVARALAGEDGTGSTPEGSFPYPRL